MQMHAALFAVLAITRPCLQNIVDFFRLITITIQKHSQNLKTRPRIQKCFGFWEVFWILASVFVL